MINAALVGCEIASLLPENETPTHTEGREGFYHLTDISGNVEKAELSYIVRDHDMQKFLNRIDYLKKIEKEMQDLYGKETVTLKIQESYRNMNEIIREHMEIVEIAKEAIREPMEQHSATKDCLAQILEPVDMLITDQWSM